jgi:hypothetical protein
MQVSRVRVQNYRSVVDSDAVEVEENVTVFIGRNEQGKTNFLRALFTFNHDRKFHPSDLPNHLRPQLEDQNHAAIPMVTIWVALSNVDLKALASLIEDGQGLQCLKITRFLDNHFEYYRDDDSPLLIRQVDIEPYVAGLRAAAEELRTRLAAHAERTANFKPSLVQAQTNIDDLLAASFDDVGNAENLLATFDTALKGMPNQDKPIQDDVAAGLTTIAERFEEIKSAKVKDHPTSKLHDLLPRFVLHESRIDDIPDEVSISDFVDAPEKTSRGMKNLCAAAGLSTKKIADLASSTDRPRREASEDFHTASISSQINEFWANNEYKIHFRFDGDKLTVAISDNVYSPRIQPSGRSDGFRWYLSFYCACMTESSASRPTVLLLDNPGLELHADQQRQAKRLLEEKLPTATQVMYVTHSPAMIDPFNFGQLRRVELVSQAQGTKVVRSVVKSDDDFDLFEPVRSAIGASIITSLIFGDYNVLVEGAADKPILDGMFRLFPPDGRKVVVNGSVAESDGFLPRFFQRSGLPFVIYVDSDSSGRGIAGRLVAWNIDPERCVALGDACSISKGEDRELEDLFNKDFYHAAVVAAYPDKPVTPPDGKHKGKITKYYEAEFREKHQIGFTKRRVADAIYDLIAQGNIDDESRSSLERLAHVLLDKLATKPSKAPSPKSNRPVAQTAVKE